MRLLATIRRGRPPETRVQRQQLDQLNRGLTDQYARLATLRAQADLLLRDRRR